MRVIYQRFRIDSGNMIYQENGRTGIIDFGDAPDRLGRKLVFMAMVLSIPIAIIAPLPANMALKKLKLPMVL